jgi:hypothetical protein
MTVIILTEAQARAFREAAGPVEMRDEQGEVLARVLPPAEAALVAEAKRRLAAGGARHSAAEVESRFQQLAEVGQREALDQARVHELLRQMRAGEQG